MAAQLRTGLGVAYHKVTDARYLNLWLQDSDVTILLHHLVLPSPGDIAASFVPLGVA